MGDVERCSDALVARITASRITRRLRLARARRSAFAVTLVAAAACILPTVALADNVEVLVDSTDVTLASGDDGTHTAEITLANLRDAAFTVTAGVADDPGCSVDPKPAAVESGRSSVVSLTLSSGCDVDQGADIELRLNPNVHPSRYVVKAAPAQAKTEIQWSILGWSALFAAVAALIAVGLVGAQILRHNRKPAATDKLRLTTPLEGLGTDWSFTDNWVNSVTAGSGLLVALLASSNLLEAILGDEPKAALALIAVTGAIAAALVGISPILVKLFGEDVAVPTIAGTLLAALVTLIGSLGQITVVTWQTQDLVTGWVPYVISLVGVLVGAIVLGYAVRTLSRYVIDDAEAPESTYPDVMKAAFVVADAIRAAVARAEGAAPSSDKDAGSKIPKEVFELPPRVRYRNSML